MPMVLGSALLPRYRMGVIEANQPLPIRSMQRERVIDPVWLSADVGTRVTTNRTQWPPSGSTTSTSPSRSRSMSRAGSRRTATRLCYHTEATFGKWVSTGKRPLIGPAPSDVLAGVESSRAPELETEGLHVPDTSAVAPGALQNCYWRLRNRPRPPKLLVGGSIPSGPANFSQRLDNRGLPAIVWVSSEHEYADKTPAGHCKTCLPLPQPSTVKPTARYAAIDGLGRGTVEANCEVSQ